MRLLVAGLLIGLTGCVSTQPASLDTPEGRALVNERAARGARLFLVGEPAVRARNLSVAADSVFWTDRLTGQMRAAPTNHVLAVGVPRADQPAFRGVLIGGAAGALVGLALLLEGDALSPAALINYTTVGGSLIGLVIGAAQVDRIENRPVTLHAQAHAVEPCAGVPLACASQVAAGHP